MAMKRFISRVIITLGTDLIEDDKRTDGAFDFFHLRKTLLFFSIFYFMPLLFIFL